MKRLHDLQQFYAILGLLEHKLGGMRSLADCNGRMCWPLRGVYFFFESGEIRRESGAGLRIVRVGTHALTSTSQTTLWQRLSQHRGVNQTGGGNHRGSIFRRHVGAALIRRDNWSDQIAGTWGQGSSRPTMITHAEQPLERTVSHYIGQMPFLWLEVDDAPSATSLRGVIERNSIALLSNFNASDNPLDPASPGWLGHWADRDTIRQSGLWNVNHVDEVYDPIFLDILEKVVSRI